MSKMSYSSALNSALLAEMGRDERVVLLGEDVAVYGGVFGVSRGLLEEFGPGRVIDTPISENGIVGTAVGMAMNGLRPVAEIMYADFLTLAMDSIANSASVLPFAYGGQVSLPMVVRTQGGMGIGTGPQHSKSLEGWTAHLPGVHTVMPSSPADAKGLLASAIRSDDPVVFIEHKRLYGIEDEVPDDEHLVPLATAKVLREGTDATVIAWSRMVSEALAAATCLAERNLDVEVIDARSLRPLDIATLAASARKTRLVAVVGEPWVRYGPSAEIAAAVTEAAFDELLAPVVRIGSLGVPLPASPALEPAVLPRARSIEQALSDLCKRGRT
jgi:pyruvate/2-oxoglutarate/acetoin dehydrogenase E1 component